MKKLWKLLIERKLLKKVLIVMSGISQSSVTMLKNITITLTQRFLFRICTALKPELYDICELISNKI